MESFAALFEESLESKGLEVEKGAVVQGEVVNIDNDWITVDTGLKSEGIVAREEFLDANRDLEVAIGDTVEVVVDAIDNGLGQTVLSRDKAKRLETWNKPCANPFFKVALFDLPLSHDQIKRIHLLIVL